MARRIDAILLGLIALDLIIAAVAFISPALWFSVFHGAAYVDPQGLLPRMAADWSAFALLQIIAILNWRTKPYWLAIVAGVRWSDMFTDWTYLWVCRDVTWFGRISLFIVSPMNVLIGRYLLKSYLRLQNQSDSNFV